MGGWGLNVVRKLIYRSEKFYPSQRLTDYFGFQKIFGDVEEIIRGAGRKHPISDWLALDKGSAQKTLIKKKKKRFEKLLDAE